MASQRSFIMEKVFDKLWISSNPHTKVLLAASMLDAMLQNLLHGHMLAVPAAEDLFRESKCLGTFSAKIDLSYALGLITELEHCDLHLIRKIRNDFAHTVDHELDFSNQSLIDRAKALRTPALLPQDHRLLEKWSDTPLGIAEARFVAAVGVLSEAIGWWRLQDVSRPEPAKSIPLPSEQPE